jgi:hypothetical protein
MLPLVELSKSASLNGRSQGATPSHTFPATFLCTWEKFIRLVDRFFPPIRILHPLPCHRFDAKTQGKSPVR